RGREAYERCTLAGAREPRTDGTRKPCHLGLEVPGPERAGIKHREAVAETELTTKPVTRILRGAKRVHVDAARHDFEDGTRAELTVIAKPTRKSTCEDDHAVRVTKEAALVRLHEAVLEAIACPVTAVDILVSDHTPAIEEHLRASRDLADGVANRGRKVAPSM